MTAHRHVDDCYGGIDGRLVCDRPGWAREHLELHVPEDELVDRYAGDLEPHRSCLVIGCGSVLISLLIVGALLAWLSGALSSPAAAGPDSVRTAIQPSSALVVDVAAPAPLVRGLATWYCGSGSACTAGHRPGELVAAIDPGVGFHRGERIRVTAGDLSVVVRIVDVCACAGERIVDLSRAAFARIADPTRGVVAVTVERLGATPTLPATDTAP